MDVDRLAARLTIAQLVLGDVAHTIPEWVSRPDILPIGFIGFDLDYYSSTRHALKVFDGSARTRLPRVTCYSVWPERACHNEFVGELLAIREFNEVHRDRKLSPIHLLRTRDGFPLPGPTRCTSCTTSPILFIA
jgi:hypothetical protein